MFVDELTIYAKAGKGGDGVVRWRRERSRPKGGPTGGNGGQGGDVYMRAVRDLGLLGKYRGHKGFSGEDGDDGHGQSRHGKDGKDCVINVPVGSTVTDTARGRIYELEHEGQKEKILLGGQGGLGNEYFKSSTNRAPRESTKGKRGESGEFFIELSLVVDVGLVGYPNAGKSTLLNALTHAHSRVGSYPFTTTEPHLGDLYGFIIADIPGLIEGAADGKGLGHKFLRHITRTKMILHLVSLEHENVIEAYQHIRSELGKFSDKLVQKDEWIILTKADLCDKEKQEVVRSEMLGITNNIFVISAQTGEGIKELSDKLVQKLRSKNPSYAVS